MGFRLYVGVSRSFPACGINLSARAEPLDRPSRRVAHVGPRGGHVTLGLPGSGALSGREHLPAAAGAPHGGPARDAESGLYRIEHIPPAPPIHADHRAAFVAVVVVPPSSPSGCLC